MSLSPAPPVPPPPIGGTVPPLTLCADKTGAPHVRFPDIEDEIRAARAASPASWSETTFRCETLVHLIRALSPRKDLWDLLGRLVHELGRRVAVIVGDYTRGFPVSVREEIADEVSHKILELMFLPAPSRKSEFLEMVFDRVVMGFTVNRVRSRRNKPRAHQFAPHADESGGSSEGGEDQSAAIVDEAPGPEEIALDGERREQIFVVLRGLTDARQRDAFILRYFDGWPIHSDDLNVPTLETRFGVSARQINNWFKAIKAKIDEATGDNS